MKSFSVLTVSKRTGWEEMAIKSVMAQSVSGIIDWVQVLEGEDIEEDGGYIHRNGERRIALDVYAAPSKTKLSNLNASLNEGLRHIDTDYVIFYQDFIDLPEDCFEKLLELATPKTFVTTCTPNYEGCFVAGTQILTTDGYKPIETLTTEDRVITPFGRDKVISCGNTGIKKVRDYGRLKATPNHKILTDRGIVLIDDLRYTDNIWVENHGQKTILGRRSTFLGFLIFAILSPKTELTDYIFNGLLTRSLEVRLAYSTEKSGNIITDRFQRVIKSTTKTGTMITRLKALNSFLQASTQSAIFGDEMWAHIEVYKRLNRLLKSGIPLKRESAGTQSEGNLTGLIKWLIREHAHNVQQHTRLGVLESVNTAALTVNSEQETREEVWNLSTENGCYIAEGVLVSNSDDGRYTGIDLPRPCTPSEWEANVAIAPMRMLRSLGGFDEDYDWGWSWDNVNVAERAAMLGAKFILDESNRPTLYPHEMSSHETLPKNGERHARTMRNIREGRKPLKLNYL